MTIPHVKPGDPVTFRATTINAFVDAANANRQGGGQNPTPTITTNDDQDVYVNNGVGTAFEEYQVLGIDGVAITPTLNEDQFRERVIFTGVMPSAEIHENAYVILAEPLSSYGVGRILKDGIQPCKINILDETHTFAGLGTSTYLDSATTGAVEILWREAGVGVKWCVVRIGAGAAAGLMVWKAVANQVGNMVSAKKMNVDGSVTGDAQDFYVTGQA